MFRINSNTKQINITRGDVGNIKVTATYETGEPYTFQNSDVVRLGIFADGNYNNIILGKDITVQSSSSYVTISLDASETTIGDIINAPVAYWYEIQLNPDTDPHTIVGHDDNGPKIFMLYPEGAKETT